jgi:hypothetical protein
MSIHPHGEVPGDDPAQSDTADFRGRLAFLELTTADRTRFHQLRESLHAVADDFVDAFYRYSYSFDETASFCGIRSSLPD